MERDRALVLRRMPDYADPDGRGTVRWFIGGNEMGYTLAIHTASGGDDAEAGLAADALERLYDALGLIHHAGQDASRQTRCPECGERLSNDRHDGSCDMCCHFRDPLYVTGWHDGPLYSCDGCLTDDERAQNLPPERGPWMTAQSDISRPTEHVTDGPE